MPSREKDDLVAKLDTDENGNSKVAPATGNVLSSCTGENFLNTEQKELP